MESRVFRSVKKNNKKNLLCLVFRKQHVRPTGHCQISNSRFTNLTVRCDGQYQRRVIIIKTNYLYYFLLENLKKCNKTYLNAILFSVKVQKTISGIFASHKTKS